MSTLSSIGATSSALSPTSPTSGSGSSSGALSVGGLITGLNTTQLIQGLLAVQQAHINQVKARQSAVTQQEVAYKSLQAQLLTFQGKVNQLAQAFNGPFDGRSAASSDPTLVTAAASGSAAAGVYTLKVNALAQANEIASQNFDSATTPITQGKLTIGSGGSSATITIDNSNATLQGLAGAINNANVGVSATIVNDGSSHPYRLLLAATKTGLANAITVDTSQLAAGDPVNGPFKPAFATTVQAAADASVSIGSATGGGTPLTITSATNTVNGVINGVTLSLTGADATKSVQVTVANDTATAKTAVQDFVTAYNGVMSAIASDTKYDPQTNTAGVLLGDASIDGIKGQLQNLVTGVVAGANPKLSSLSALGITSDDTGQLQINDGKLTGALSGQVSGVTLADVRNLFAFSGQSTNPGVNFANATTATKASSAPYGVKISQPALQAVLTGDTALDPTQVTAGHNSFSLTVNGSTTPTITLPLQSYATAQAVVQALQAQINGNSQVGGQQIGVGLVGGLLTFTSGAYGKAASLAVSGASFLGFNTTKGASGQDVAGSFLVGGSTEPATGGGQLLTGNGGNAHTDGLAVQVGLLGSQLNADPTVPEASLTVTRGVASQLSSALSGLLDAQTGRLQTLDQNFQDKISSYQKTIDQLTQEYTIKQNQLTQQFTQLETTVSNLKNAGGFLSAQTAALQSLSSGSTSTTH